MERHRLERIRGLAEWLRHMTARGLRDEVTGRLDAIVTWAEELEIERERHARGADLWAEVAAVDTAGSEKEAKLLALCLELHAQNKALRAEYGAYVAQITNLKPTE